MEHACVKERKKKRNGKTKEDDDDEKPGSVIFHQYYFQSNLSRKETVSKTAQMAPGVDACWGARLAVFVIDT